MPTSELPHAYLFSLLRDGRILVLMLLDVSLYGRHLLVDQLLPSVVQGGKLPQPLESSLPRLNGLRQRLDGFR